MTVWADADSMPPDARRMLVRFAVRRGVPVCFTANRAIPLFTTNPLARMAVTEGREGAADDYIASHAAPGDAAVTRDVPLAARLLARGVAVVSDRGETFSPETIGERLSLRNFAISLAEIGAPFTRAKKYGRKETAAFAACLERMFRGALKTEELKLRTARTSPV